MLFHLILNHLQKPHYVKSVSIRSFSGPYFPVFGLNTGKYGPEKTPYLDTFHAVPMIYFWFSLRYMENLLK